MHVKKRHGKEKTVVCVLCKCTIFPEGYVDHVEECYRSLQRERREKENDELSGPTCGKVFKGKIKVCKHALIHDEKNLKKCPDCKKTFWL